MKPPWPRQGTPGQRKTWPRQIPRNNSKAQPGPFAEGGPQQDRRSGPRSHRPGWCGWSCRAKPSTPTRFPGIAQRRRDCCGKGQAVR